MDERCMKITVAATQMHCTWDVEANVERATALVRRAVDEGANVVLLQELFETPYFCINTRNEHMELAKPLAGHPTIDRLRALAREYELVLPVSYFEKSGLAHYNSIAVIDADGQVLGNYRKSHIPDFPLYEEKFYFSPGDTGFRVFETRYGTLGVAICWDQWFPEAARAMVLLGAEILFYPTAIGSEKFDQSFDSKDHWQMVMRGHAAANIVPVVASNRVGEEASGADTMRFYGSSFIAGPQGTLLAEADRESEAVLTHTFDLDEIRNFRRTWGLFRDRRPDLYGTLLTMDGHTRPAAP
jgi:N-carbamoylputrescine amidase